MCWDDSSRSLSGSELAVSVRPQDGVLLLTAIDRSDPYVDSPSISASSNVVTDHSVQISTVRD